LSVLLRQGANELVEVRDWIADEGQSAYPEGSREKVRLRCPKLAPFSFLLAEHYYLFKESSHRYPEQFWAEVVAYRIGAVCGINVPPAFAAFNSSSKKCAALIEWFYGKAGGPQIRYVSGGDIMSTIVADYDLKRGKKHAFVAIQGWLKKRAPSELVFQTQMIIWARMLTFDALIGNTDRHHDNWGTMWLNERQFSFAPAFDNGTSLGHELTISRIETLLKNNAEMDAYIWRGTHHLRWRETDEKKMNHGELLRLIAASAPYCLPYITQMLLFESDDLSAEIKSVARIECPIRLSDLRVDFMISLTLRRRELLVKKLEQL